MLAAVLHGAAAWHALGRAAGQMLHCPLHAHQPAAAAPHSRSYDQLLLGWLAARCFFSCRYHPGMDEVTLSWNEQTQRVEMEIAEVGAGPNLSRTAMLAAEAALATCAGAAPAAKLSFFVCLPQVSKPNQEHKKRCMLSLLSNAVAAHSRELGALLAGRPPLRFVVETEDFGVVWRGAKWKLPAFAMCTGALPGGWAGLHAGCCLQVSGARRRRHSAPAVGHSSTLAQLTLTNSPSRRPRAQRHPGARFYVSMLPRGPLQEQQLARHPGGQRAVGAAAAAAGPGGCCCSWLLRRQLPDIAWRFKSTPAVGMRTGGECWLLPAGCWLPASSPPALLVCSTLLAGPAPAQERHGGVARARPRALPPQQLGGGAAAGAHAAPAGL